MLLLIAIRRPKLRIWPPPGIGSVQWLAVWGLTILAFGGIVAVGLEGGLARGALYRFTRNPQYLGDLALLGGWVALAASTSVRVAPREGLDRRRLPTSPTC